jgi:hypothetical protein
LKQPLTRTIETEQDLNAVREDINRMSEPTNDLLFQLLQCVEVVLLHQTSLQSALDAVASQVHSSSPAPLFFQAQCVDVPFECCLRLIGSTGMLVLDH